MRIGLLYNRAEQAGIRRSIQASMPVYQGVAAFYEAPYWFLCVGNDAPKVPKKRGPKFKEMNWQQGWIDFHPLLLQEESRMPLASLILRRIKVEAQKRSGQEEQALLKDIGDILYTGSLLIPYIVQALSTVTFLPSYFQNPLEAFRVACYVAKKAEKSEPGISQKEWRES